MSVWWLTIHTPDGVHCWPLGEDEEAFDEPVTRARVAVGFPASDDWVTDPASRWRVQLAPGEPHHRVLTAATVHAADDLAAVKPAALTAHRAQREQGHRAARVEAAHAVLDQLPDAERAEVLAARATHAPRR